MKMNANGGLPPHRLPVLTEVVQLTEDGLDSGETVAIDLDLPLLDQAVPPAPVAFTAPVPDLALQAVPAPRPIEPPVLTEQPLPVGHDAPAPPEWLKRRPAHVRVGLPLPAMAPPSPLPADFSGSWWSRDEGPALVTAPVPVPVPIPAPLRPVETVSEDVLVQRVLERLDGQVDQVFDERMREALLPALARAADTLMAELRQQLHGTLREMVSQAVAVELVHQAHRRENGS